MAGTFSKKSFFGFLILPVTILLADTMGNAYAQDTKTAQALKMITDTAAEICQSAPLEESSNGVKLSGDTQAKLGGVIGQLADLGISGAASYQSSRSKGVLQQDLVTAIQSSNGCKLEVFRTLERDLLQQRGSESSPPSPSPAVAVPQFAMPTLTLEKQATQFAYDFMRRGGMPVDQMIQFVTNYYADEVLYFDKGYVDRGTIIRDKSSYFGKWPTRTYTVLPGVFAQCAPTGDCLVDGNVKYNLRGGYKELCGTASFTLGVSFHSSSPVLNREQGEARSEPCS